METSKVYIQIDFVGRIIRCEGGYATPADLTGWVEIDEGEGDRYNLCQAHYFDGGLYTMDGIPRYKYVNGACALRTDAEVEADRAAIPSPQPGKTLEEVAAYLNETAQAVMELSVE
ncbi:hypothetical protein [Oscillibacter sp.]|uniref:hypothetical protein n=1 Tax=Oscillibacter sp. TaxID=1945593 RepID=UPI0028979B53|nr:hypothetical protein [Oscillibacter sp.]